MSRHFPAEWAPQEAVVLTWPHAATDWLSQLIEVEKIYLHLAQAISQRQSLVIACHDEAVRQHVIQQLTQAHIPSQAYHCYLAPCDDTWARDHGPISVYENDQRVLLDFEFNAWGNKYAASQDNLVTRRLHAAGAFGSSRLDSLDWVLEGGSIDSDGQGTLLTTQACLLSPQRHPELSPADVEQYLQSTLGIQRVLWLQHGYLSGDDTDSHIDTLARFCDPETIAYVACDDASDEHFLPLQAMATELKALRQSNGRPYRLMPLPWPAPQYNSEGQRLPATYANFLLINQAVLVPTYRDVADSLALEQLARCFPQRDIIGIDCLPLIQQFGSLHCVTMQLPT